MSENEFAPPNEATLHHAANSFYRDKTTIESASLAIVLAASMAADYGMTGPKFQKLARLAWNLELKRRRTVRRKCGTLLPDRTCGE